MAKDQGPPTWQDALSQASQVIAAGLAAPDADVKFGLAMIGALNTHLKQKSGGAGAGAPGGPPGAGGAGSPGAGGAMPPGGPPPAGMGGPGGPAGGGAPNSAMPSMAAPGGPTPGGMSQGLSPNPDELRRVLSDVAGG
jgi:hypothetical protein